MYQKIKSLLVSLTLCVASATAWANEPIQVVIAVPPGGGTDTLARAITAAATRQGTPMIVVNRPGGDQIIGMNSVATARPDGRTVIIGAINGNASLPIVLDVPNLEYNRTDKKMVPVSYLASLPYIITARPDFPANNPQELMDLIRKNPDKYAIGTFSKTTQMLAANLFASAGTKARMIPYKGDAPMTVDIVGGNLPLGISAAPTVKGLVAEGKIKVIGVLNNTGDPSFPNAQSFTKLTGINFDIAWGVFAPPWTPPATVERLHRIFNAALLDPETQNTLRAQSLVPRTMPIAEFDRFYEAQFDILKRMARNLPKE